MFEFLHPLVLLLLPVVWLLVYGIYHKQNGANVWKKYIEKDFLPHLLKQHTTTTLPPILFFGVVLSVMVIAIASPSWRFKPQTQGNETSEVVWVVRVSESMLQKDLFPSRLKRAIFKMEDYLGRYKRTHSALIAYNGSAHLVLPMSKDSAVLTLFASSLAPEIMPAKGDALYDAVKLASKEFVQMQGTIVVLSDTFSPSQKAKIDSDPSLKSYKIVFYHTISQALQKNQPEDGILLSRNDSDIKQLHSTIKAQYEAFQSAKKEHKENGGYYLVPLIAVLMLGWFRRGYLAQIWRML